MYAKTASCKKKALMLSWICINLKMYQTFIIQIILIECTCTLCYYWQILIIFKQQTPPNSQFLIYLGKLIIKWHQTACFFCRSCFAVRNFRIEWRFVENTRHNKMIIIISFQLFHKIINNKAIMVAALF